MSKTIVALDFKDDIEAISFVDIFKEEMFFKVGMELIYGSGFGIVRELKAREHRIFLDLKLHDIPNTVGSAMRNISKLGVDMVNVHCIGGMDMMKEALIGLEGSGKRPLLIGVTELTSTSKEMMNQEQGIDGEVIDTVIRLSKNAKLAGLDGVVSSVLEVEDIHKNCGDDFITVTPGIRFENDSKDDQHRVSTPSYAKKMGSDYIVVGRSITRSDRPLEVYSEIERIMR